MSHITSASLSYERKASITTFSPESSLLLEKESMSKCESKTCKKTQAVNLQEIKNLRQKLHELSMTGKTVGHQHRLSQLATQNSRVVNKGDKNAKYCVEPSYYSIENHGPEKKAMNQRLLSAKTSHVLNSIPTDIPNRVAKRITQAFVDPLKAVQYLHSSEFGNDVIELSRGACKILEAENRSLSIKSPVYVFGDIHGNLTDLKFFSENIWKLGMELTAGRFLFLGDYVDRGLSSIECIAYLFAQKILNPNKVFLLRGNHEMRSVNGWEEHYGISSFLGQCKKRFGNEDGCVVWHEVNNAFDRMPLSAVIDDDIFCVHGGIPKPLCSENEIHSINQIPTVAPLENYCIENNSRNLKTESLLQMAKEMLWADPASEEKEKGLDKAGFGKSTRGGDAICFGDTAIDNFLNQNGFSYIVRAHEACTQGVSLSKSARVLTVFSTSKDHGLGNKARCGCLLIENDRILVINRSPKYNSTFVHQRNTILLNKTHERRNHSLTGGQVTRKRQVSVETSIDSTDDEEEFIEANHIDYYYDNNQEENYE